MTRRSKRLAPVKSGPAYAQLWRLVDGAIRDALTMHPDYLTARGAHMHTARRSIAKRVTGAILSFAEQSARGPTRSPCLPRAERAEATSIVEAHDGSADHGPSPMLQPSAAGGSRERARP